MADTHGSCDPAFNRIRDLFQERLNSGDELGASLCVNIDGKNVLDIWGGYADAAKTRPWEEDTLTVVWSCSKIVSALAALTLVDRGQLDVEERVSTYWPEFAVNGKEDVKVWQILSHSSGLPSWEDPVTMEFVYDIKSSTEKLAQEAPWWTPGESHGYHMMTHGHLIGELVRRISGKGLKQFIDEEIAGPLGADFRLGVPEADWPRTADITPPPPHPGLDLVDRESIAFKAMTHVPPVAETSMTPGFRKAELGAANGFGNARALARIGSMVSLKGTVDGKQYLSPKTVDQMIQERVSGPDLVIGLNLRFALGVALTPAEPLPFVPGGTVCFWGGWGGSMIVMDLSRRMTLAYAMNKMSLGTLGNDNTKAYFKAVYEIVNSQSSS
jgi:CubicO group peptidase (beta-lactamase class C family)